MRFQDLFHSPPGVLFTFPLQYLFTIDLVYSLALESGLPSFTPDFSCLMLLKKLLQIDIKNFGYGAFTLFGGPSQVLLLF